MHVVVFEGVHWKTFAPLSLGRPVFMLASGMSVLLDKQLRQTNPARVTLWVRPELAEFARRRIVPRLKVPAQVNVPLDDQPALLLSGRTLPLRPIECPKEDGAVVDEEGLVRMARVRMPGLSPDDVMQRSDRWLRILDLPRMEDQTRMVRRLWDLIKWNEESLIEDAHRIPNHRPKPVGPYHMVEEQNVRLADDVSIQPGVVLDATRGPVMVDHHATLGANAVIQGPCYIGPHVMVSPHAFIRPGTSVGAMCKVGGEVASSILFGYTNKIHEGYLGDSYVGKWVNLGANTTTSNLKNTYGEISVHTKNGMENTGRRFLGAMIGDHVKTAIGTRMLAGTYVGFSSMLSTSGFTPTFVPSYSFLTDRGLEAYRLEKAVEVMKTVFARRNRTWDDIDEQVVRYVCQTAPTVE